MVRHENLPGRSFRPPVPFKKREQHHMPKNRGDNFHPQAPSGPSGLNRSRYSNNNRGYHSHRAQYGTRNSNNQAQSSQDARVNRPVNNTTDDRPPKNWIVTIAEYTIRNIKTQRVLVHFHNIWGPPLPNPHTLQASNTGALPLSQAVAEESQDDAEIKSTSRADTPFSETGSSSDAFQDVDSSPGDESHPLELSSVWNGPMTDDTFLEHNQMHDKISTKKLASFDPVIGQRYLAAIPGPTITLRSLLKDINASTTKTYPEQESDRLWLLHNLDREAHQPTLLQSC